MVEDDAGGDEHPERLGRCRRDPKRPFGDLDGGPARPSCRNQQVQHRLHEGASRARHDRGPGRIPLVDLEEASDAVTEQLERLSDRISQGRLRRLVVKRSREVQEDAQGSLHVERRLTQEPQTCLVLRAHGRVLEEEVGEAEDAKEGIGDVVRDVGSQFAERGRACERGKLVLDCGSLIVRKRQYR